MFLLEGLAAVAAKIASASTLAQVATGVGITVAGVTGAGAAGILPGVVQDGVAGAVEAVSPFDLPDSADDRVTGVDDHRDEAETDDSGRDGIDDVPGADPTQVPVVSTPAAPSTSHETEVEVEVEAGDDDGIHQHRGGRATEPTSAVRTDNSGPGSANSGRDHAEDDDHATGATAPSTVDTPEVEDESDDDGGHHGGNSGSGSGSDDRDDDSSGHGGDDD